VRHYLQSLISVDRKGFPVPRSFTICSCSASEVTHELARTASAIAVRSYGSCVHTLRPYARILAELRPENLWLTQRPQVSIQRSGREPSGGCIALAHRGYGKHVRQHVAGGVRRVLEDERCETIVLARLHLAIGQELLRRGAALLVVFREFVPIDRRRLPITEHIDAASPLILRH
jgi:hypothetical protein